MQAKLLSTRQSKITLLCDFLKYKILRWNEIVFNIFWMLDNFESYHTTGTVGWLTETVGGNCFECMLVGFVDQWSLKRGSLDQQYVVPHRFRNGLPYNNNNKKKIENGSNCIMQKYVLQNWACATDEWRRGLFELSWTISSWRTAATAARWCCYSPSFRSGLNLLHSKISTNKNMRLFLYYNSYGEFMRIENRNSNFCKSFE